MSHSVEPRTKFNYNVTKFNYNVTKFSHNYKTTITSQTLLKNSCGFEPDDI